MNHSIWLLNVIGVTVNRGHALQWRHNGRDGVSNHQTHDCLLNRSFRRRSKKTSKLCVTGLCAENSPVTGEFPVQRSSNAENVFIWWRHHDSIKVVMCHFGTLYIVNNNIEFVHQVLLQWVINFTHIFHDFLSSRCHLIYAAKYVLTSIHWSGVNLINVAKYVLTSIHWSAGNYGIINPKQGYIL